MEPLDAEVMPLAPDAADVKSVLKAAMKQCLPALDRKLQEVTRAGSETPWRIEGDVADLTQALAVLIASASEDAPEGGEIVVTLAPLDGTATVTTVAAGAACGPPRVLVLNHRPH